MSSSIRRVGLYSVSQNFALRPASLNLTPPRLQNRPRALRRLNLPFEHTLASVGDSSVGIFVVGQFGECDLAICHSEPVLWVRNLLCPGKQRIPRAILPRFGMTRVEISKLTHYRICHHRVNSCIVRTLWMLRPL